MGELKIKRRPSRSPQIGDLRERITINARGIGAPVFGSASFNQALTVLATVWAKVETRTSKQIFDGVETQDGEIVTHIFTVRYLSGITRANIIGYDEENFKILSIENPDKRKRFLDLYCKLLGDDDIEANK